MSKRFRCASLIAVLLTGGACARNTVTSPTPTIAAPAGGPQTGTALSMESAVQASRSYTIAFGDVGPHGSAVTTYTEAAFLISITQASWTVVTTHGTPPFIKFDSPAGVTTTGELTVTAPGEPPFRLSSVDLYSSTTTIPYVITGILSGHTKFTVAGTLGNTFGNFARVDNPHGNVPVDTLVIRLTNAAFSCCTNPMGLDTIVVRR